MTAPFMDSPQQPIHTPKQGLEALRQQLFRTYMELDYTRRASNMQAKVTDAKLQQLQAKLDATVKERDGAFQECKKLRRLLLQFSNKLPQPNQCVHPSTHTASTCLSMQNSTKQQPNMVSEIHERQSAYTQSLTEHPNSSMLTSGPFQDTSLDIATLEPDELTIFDKDNSWPMDASNEQISRTISSDFSELNNLELPELQEENNFVLEWDTHLAEATLSSQSSADSTAASQMPSKENAKHHLLIPQYTTGSPLECPTFRVNSFISNPIEMGKPSAMHDTTNGTLMAASSQVSSLSARTPLDTMAMQPCVGPGVQTSSESQSASANECMPNHLPDVLSFTPSASMSASSQSTSPIAKVSNLSAKPTISLLAMSASQSTSMASSAYTSAGMPDWFTVPKKLHSSTTSTLAPTPRALAARIPMPRSASEVPRQNLSPSQQASMPLSFTSAQNTTHMTALRSSQSRSLFSTSSPYLSTSSPTNTLSKINQAPALTLRQKRRHLPEPPEANMDNMLSSLPKKGKLLEAVVQAGPLLQQLIRAGPMPIWQHPPPQLSTGHIPRVPTSPNSVLSPFSHPPSCLNASQFLVKYGAL
ncbi:hypothetical protein L7F22_052550 [Adiantum nelumboides]|nr:hypothetical protein [Adiantum nelumboides]